MKRKEFVYVTVSLVLITGMLTACNKQTTASKGPTQVRKLVFGVSPGTSANAFIDDNGNVTGLEVEVIRAVDERLPQYEVEIETLEYRSLFAALGASRLDLIGSNLRRNVEREEFPHAYRGHNNWANRLHVLADDTSISGRLEDLAGKRVGVNQGTISATFMEDYIKSTGIDIELVYSINSPDDLIARRIETFIRADNLLPNLNREYQDRGIVFKTVGDSIDSTEGVDTDHNVYYFFAKGNEDLRDDFSEAIYQLRQDGTLSKLQLQFFYEDRVHLIDEEEEIKQMKELGKI